MRSQAQDDMSAADMAMRKFLKQVGVTAHQELSEALSKAVRSGALAAGATVSVSATIESADLQLSHVVTANLQAPDSDG
jgi:hypothetical protein